MRIREQRGYDLTGYAAVLTTILGMSDEEARLTILFRNGQIDAAELCERLSDEAEDVGAKRLLVDASDYLCASIEGGV